MEKLSKKIIYGSIIFMIFLSCSEDDSMVSVLPTEEDASFTYTVDDENENTIHFSANPSLDTWFTHWSFGDGTTAQGLEVTKTYFTKGDYSVRFKMYTNNGAVNSNQMIPIANDVIDDSNLVMNGSFDDESGWTIVNQFEASNQEGDVNIANGVATFTEKSSTWKHMGIYTEVELTAGTYQFDMDMTFTEINDIWGEVYLGTSEPQANVEYSGDFQVLKAYNAWDCSPKTYSGKATAFGCDPKPSPGNFTITEAGTYYLLFRTGGAQYGADGIVIDNIELREQ
jgi:hypothetical protein